jgi:predicted phage tail protein
VQVAAGGQVSFQWTASADATSYQLDVVQPALGSINTNSPVPSFAATGVPNGQYRVQVRGVNASGTSAPSNVVDVIVGSSTPCATPAAPVVTGSVANGVASVVWSAVPGATSYIVRAGTSPGASDLFNGNVGATTSVSATGVPAGFRAYVRVLAVSACGTSVPSAEILIGG